MGHILPDCSVGFPICWSVFEILLVVTARRYLERKDSKVMPKSKTGVSGDMQKHGCNAATTCFVDDSWNDASRLRRLSFASWQGGVILQMEVLAHVMRTHPGRHCNEVRSSTVSMFQRLRMMLSTATL